ncbi:hypothetical protein OGAPHI_000968 [Ogataea philodendri]|uniref:Uncharacterized protein n=1 Tax=Ogataea philodendri TaxID=1378263 RepID=A0A9P8PDV7_9ASCO|nr:uncharacterized protein OGAPHI_000968 [Ogataea philodendri]KAH3670453.1 hypothetical protein OGAPHI_000968 [Ogataea philodendri]
MRLPRTLATNNKQKKWYMASIRARSSTDSHLTSPFTKLSSNGGFNALIWSSTIWFPKNISVKKSLSALKYWVSSRMAAVSIGCSPITHSKTSLMNFGSRRSTS